MKTALAMEKFAAYGKDELVEALMRCCECRPWAEALAAAGPFASEEVFLKSAWALWSGQPEAVRIEAFNAKPEIGDLDALRKKHRGDSSSNWDAAEQAGVKDASDDVLRGLIDGNREYFEKFGFRFITFATGKAAGDMLAELQHRLTCSRKDELETATAENHKITELRFEKWLGLRSDK